MASGRRSDPGWFRSDPWTYSPLCVFICFHILGLQLGCKFLWGMPVWHYSPQLALVCLTVGWQVRQLNQIISMCNSLWFQHLHILTHDQYQTICKVESKLHNLLDGKRLLNKHKVRIPCRVESEGILMKIDMACLARKEIWLK